jgi:photosystem II stability/assembly factor-like uncharacterized protein
MGYLSRLACAAAAALALLSTASAGVNTPQSGWYSGNPLLGPNALLDLSCAGTTCYAAGTFGTLLKSTDSGATWKGIVTGLTLDVPRVRLAGGASDHVVAGGGCAVRRSNDGGDTFFRLPLTARDSGCSDGVASFSFPTDKTGYFILSSGRILVTVDGGRTFARRTPLPGGAQGRDILCVSERTCFAAGSGAGAQRTDDGAVSWTAVTPNYTLTSLARADAQTLFAVGQSSVIIKSTDGGSTWVRKPDLPGFPNLRKIACGDGLHCLVVTENGAPVYRTTDGGESFTAVVPSSDQTFALGFVTPVRAVAAGGFGSAEVSDDAGVTWSVVGSRIRDSFQVLAAGSSEVAYAGGQNGALARTVDAGQTWSNVSPPTDAQVGSIAASGPNRLYVLASDGTLQRSDNGGASYGLLNPGTARPVAIEALDPDRLILLGHGPPFFSTNGGESFQQASGKLARADFRAADPAAGAVFAYGTLSIAESVDRGVHWVAVKKPKKRAVADLDFVSRNLGYLLDTRGALWKTTNGGWKWRPIAVGAAGYAAEFSSAQSGYVAIRNFGTVRNRGLVLRTSDGGRSWHPQIVSESPVVALESTSATDFALSGDNALFATQVGGDIGAAETIRIAARPKALRRPGRAVISGRLTPADGGEEIVVSNLVRGRWASHVATAAANGTFSLRLSLADDSVVVAQVLGDADHRGAGTAPLLVRVR